MTFADSLEGSAFFLPTLAAALLTGSLLINKRWRYLGGSQRVLAFSVLSTAALLFAHVIPTMLGILTRGSVLACSLLILVAAWRLAPSDAAEPREERRPPPSSGLSIAVCVAAVAIALVYQVARVDANATKLPDFIDALGFHLPGIATWIQTGTIWRVDQFLPGFATAQYPNNGDLLILASVLPWHSLALARLSMVPFFLLTGVSTYALALELGASRAASATFGAAAMTVPYISRYALAAIPDVVALAMFGAGLLFALRYERYRTKPDLALGSLAFGLALGTKWYGLTAVAVVVVVLVAAWLLARRGLRETMSDTAIMLAAIGLGGGVWLVRNWVESGNPIYPKAVSLLGVQLFAGSHNDVIDQYGYTIAHYLVHPTILRVDIYPGFKLALGLTGLVVLAGLAIAAITALRTRRSLDRRLSRPVTELLIITVGICVIYVLTPGTAYGPKNMPTGGYPTLRWLMPAVISGLAVAAAAARRVGRAGLLLELAGLVGLIDGVILGDDLGFGRVLGATAAVAVLAALATLTFSSRHAFGRWRWGAVVLAPVAAIGIWLVQRSFDRQSYASYDPVFAWIDTHAPSGHRVGITGEANLNGLAPVLPLAGPRLGNRLAYVGDEVAHSVQLPRSASSFRADVKRGRYDLLEIGLQYTGHTDQWAREMGYRLVATSDRLALYQAPATRSRW